MCGAPPTFLGLIITFNACNYRSASHWNTSDTSRVLTPAVIFFLLMSLLGCLFLFSVPVCCHGTMFRTWLVQCEDINYIATYRSYSQPFIFEHCPYAKKNKNKNTGWKCLSIHCIRRNYIYCLFVTQSPFHFTSLMFQGY